MIKSSYNSLLIHVGCWLLYIVLVSIVDPFESTDLSLWIGGWLLFLVGYASLFYGIGKVILPRFWHRSKSKAILYTALSAIPFVAYFHFVDYYGLPYLKGKSGPAKIDYAIFLVHNIYMFIRIQIFAIFYFYYHYTVSKLKERQAAELVIRDKTIELRSRENSIIQKELSFLKSQFNAHITFNVLTVIYNKIYNLDKEAAYVVELFSEILRYSADNRADSKISIKDEIQYLKNFIELQKIIKDKVCVQFICEGDAEDKKIFPRILINFVENAFKHGISNDANRPIICKLTMNGNIHFEIENAKGTREYAVSSHGIGTENLVQTLESYYSNRYILDIKESENYYRCSLMLN